MLENVLGLQIIALLRVPTLKLRRKRKEQNVGRKIFQIFPCAPEGRNIQSLNIVQYLSER
jgi:hypothetical protein